MRKHSTTSNKQTESIEPNHPIADLTGFQGDLLAVVAGFEAGVYQPNERAHPIGRSICDVLESIYGREINHGRLYPNLDSLADVGLIRREEANRRANFYRLTRSGREALESYHEWQGTVLAGRAP